MGLFHWQLIHPIPDFFRLLIQKNKKNQIKCIKKEKCEYHGDTNFGLESAGKCLL